MYIVSPFTPLFFSPSKDTTGSPSRYVQLFARTDEILVEVITAGEVVEITGTLVSAASGMETTLEWKVWSMNASDKLYYCVITGLEDGCYYVDINGASSEIFRITSDERELSGTTLLQYSSKDNRAGKDAVFWIAEQQKFFDFRVPGGFKDDGWSFNVENEQFTNSDNDLSEIYSRATTRKTFTMGGGSGCPIWFGDMLNRILSCTYVYFDGNRFVRSEQSVPEVTKVLEGKRSYVFSQIVQETNNVDAIETANQLIIRRVENETLRSVASRLRIL